MKLLVLTSVFFTLLGGMVLAQGSPDRPPAGSQGSVEGPPPSDGEFGNEDLSGTNSNVAMGEMSATAARYRAEMQGLLRQVTAAHDQSLKQKDTVKSLCVGDALLFLKEVLNQADEASNTLEVALGRNDEDAARFEFQKIEKARSMAQQHASDALACFGEDGFFLAGPAENTVDGPSDPDDLTRDNSSDPQQPVIEPEPIGSPVA